MTTSIKKEIITEFREKFVFEGEYPGDGSKMLYLRNDVEAIESFLSLALTRIEEAAREEMVKEFGIVLDKINQGLREESPYKREILFKDAKDIMSSLSPSEEKENHFVDPNKIEVVNNESKVVNKVVNKKEPKKEASDAYLEKEVIKEFLKPQEEKRGR